MNLVALTDDGVNRLVIVARRILVVEHEKHSVSLTNGIEHILRRGDGQEH